MSSLSCLFVGWLKSGIYVSNTSQVFYVSVFAGAHGEVDTAHRPGFIVLETNFRVLAYTGILSPLAGYQLCKAIVHGVAN